MHIPHTRMISFPYQPPSSWLGYQNPPTHAFGTLPLVGSQQLGADFHLWRSYLELITLLWKQYYNNPEHTWQLCPHIGPTSVQAVMFCSGVGSVINATSLYQPLGLWARPLPHRQVIFCLSPKSWGQVDIFPQPLGLETWSPHQLQTSITSLSNLRFYRATNPSISTPWIDADELLTCPIWANIAEVIVVLTSAILGATPRSLLSHHIASWSVEHYPQAMPHSNCHIS